MVRTIRLPSRRARYPDGSPFDEQVPSSSINGPPATMFTGRPQQAPFSTTVLPVLPVPSFAVARQRHVQAARGSGSGDLHLTAGAGGLVDRQHDFK